MRDLLARGILGLLNYGDMSGYEIKPSSTVAYYLTTQTTDL